MHWRALSATAVAIAIVVAGCGGSSGIEGSPAALTRAEFARQADAVCASTLEDIQQQSGEASNGKMTADAAKVFSATIDAELSALEKLEPPSELSSAFDGYKSTIDARRDIVLRAGARSNTSQGLAERQLEQTTRAGRLVVRLGLRSCS